MRFLLPALLVLAATAAVVIRRPPEAPYSEGNLARLLQAPSKAGDGTVEPAYRRLFEHPAVTRNGTEAMLRLGRVLASPTAARGSAESAGELLELEATAPTGPLGKPLWRVLFEGPWVKAGTPRRLELYGCRHSADLDAGPVIEDTYHARLALAEALRAHGAAFFGLDGLELVGAEAPVRGGLNFEVRLTGPRQSLVVTFPDAAPALSVGREHRPLAAHDAEARRAWIAVVQELYRREFGTQLHVEGVEQPAPDGLDVLIEVYASNLSLSVTGCGVGFSSVAEVSSK